MLNQSIKSLMELYGEQIVNDLIQRMNEQNINATGKGARDLRFRASGNGLQIEGYQYLTAVDAGVPKYKGKKPPAQALEEWIQAKIAPDLDRFELRRLSFAISKSIAKNGTIKRFQYSGSDFIQFVIDKNINNMAMDLADIALEAVDKEVTAELRTYKDIQVI